MTCNPENLTWDPDAAIRSCDVVKGLDVVIRNSRGELMTGSMNRIEFLEEMELAKAKAIRFGTNVAKVSCL
ncbi:hypothetical protein WN943_018267 [Citrus x changshan-huyou]